MKTTVEKEIRAAKSMNEIWDIINAHYNMDKSFNSFSGGLVKEKIIQNMDSVITALSIPERPAPLKPKDTFFKY